MRSSNTGLFFSATLLAVFTVARADTLAMRRPFTVEDLLAQEAITEVTLSPDHTMLAYVRFTPVVSRNLPSPPAWNNSWPRSEVWVAKLSAELGPGRLQAIQLEKDENSYTSPKWSPDGSKLAVVVHDVQSGYHLAVWDSRTNRLTRLGGKNLTLTFSGMRGFGWMDNERLVTFAEQKGDGRTAPSFAPSTALAIAERLYQGTLGMMRAEQATAHVLESGEPFDAKAYPSEGLVLLDVNGSMKTLATGVHLAELSSASPDMQHVAYLRQVGRRPVDNSTHFDYSYTNFGEDAAKLVMDVTDMTGHSIQYPAGVQPAAMRTRTFCWSLDGKSFAYLGSREETTTPHVYRGTLDGTLEEVACGSDIIPRSLLWTRDGLLIAGERTSLRGDVDALKRRDWWLATPGASPKLLTAELKSVPSSLLRAMGGRWLIGVANGDVWRLDLDTAKWANLTASSRAQVAGLLSFGSDLHGENVLLSTDGDTPESIRLNIATGVQSLLARPSLQAKAVAYDEGADIAILLAHEDTGTHLTMDQHGSNQPLLAINQQLAEIEPGKPRMFQYTGEDGEQLTGWLLLPPDYQEGKRYPLVTWVYAGSTYSRRLPIEFELNLNYALRDINLQLFAARGYVVLLPSMPLPSRGRAGDMYLELAKGVIPAVDEVIRLGIADSERLAVAGWSFGGFSVNGLITQTIRFRAAISGAGLSDFASAFGTFPINKRYRDAAFSQDVSFHGMQIVEAGQGHLGTPWLDGGRYLRNSPVMYADRVKTPLLLIHGDMDTAVPIQQSDEMFSALMRQGKRARYVQYNGEGHVILSPANVRDMWQQMFAWLDQYLAPVSGGK